VESIAWSFGNFTLLADRRLLMAGGAPVRLGGRALDILIALVEYAGQFVTRDELIARIWGERVVEEINLRVQVAAVRRVLGDEGGEHPQFILNVPARGYCFVAPVTRSGEVLAPPSDERKAMVLRTPLTTLVGREQSVAELGKQLLNCRSVTVVGTGGIGKSASAVRVAAEAAPRYRDGVCHVDLCGIADGRIATTRIAEAIGMSSGRQQGDDSLVSALHESHLLLLLDGCEGVVDMVAMLAQEILAEAPGVDLLATSREPLRIPGEQVHRLGPLAIPSTGTLSTLESVLEFSSVQLFSERAYAASGNFDPTSVDAGLMMDICRRLDGVPLAIELAAHRVEHLGLAGILAQLDDGFDILVDERRADEPHQQSLGASFDWSFANLTSDERCVLCRLSAFAGDFSLASGAHLASFAVDDGHVRELIGQLANKSLVSVDTGARGVRYRLLGATRAYARVQLRARDDHEATLRRHAELTVGLVEAADSDLASQSSQNWLLRHSAALEDVRSALAWLSTRRDEAALHMRLLAASSRLWYQLSAVAEYCNLASGVLGSLSSTVADSDRIQVYFGVGRARLHVHGRDAESFAAFDRAFAMAERLGDHQDHLMALWGLWLDHCLSGRYADALDLAGRYERLATSAATGPGVAGDRMLLVSFLNTGRHADARARGERALASIFLMPVTGAGARPQLEQGAIARAHLARVLWLQGLPDSALAMAREAVDLARQSMHDITNCLCLHGLCVIASWTGQRNEARDAAHALSVLAAKHRLGLWAAWARFHENAMAFADGEPMPPDWREPRCGIPQLELMATYSADLLEPEIVLRAEEGNAAWCEPEVLRARGCHAARLETEQGKHQALALFGRALLLARAQGALAWELRVATSIAAISDQPEESWMAIDLLTKTLDRFTEGSTTPDIRHARDLLARLRSR
jgi:predicted ATPase/DNA-binding winged helix-turn-helix (wHTH) protein